MPLSTPSMSNKIIIFSNKVKKNNEVFEKNISSGTEKI